MWVFDARDAVWSDFRVLHRIDDCWEDIDAWTFWRLVGYLPAYQSATRTAIQILAAEAKDGGTVKAPQQSSSYPTTSQEVAPGVSVVPAEALNAILGGPPLLSWSTTEAEESA